MTSHTEREGEVDFCDVVLPGGTGRVKKYDVADIFSKQQKCGKIKFIYLKNYAHWVSLFQFRRSDYL